MGKTFPIREGVACQQKWTWNTVRLQEATTACCHRVRPLQLTADDFDNFHNHPTWISHRKLQLAGQFPQQGCEYCEQIEKHGGISDRILHLEDQDVYPPELDQDLKAVHVTPRILEVFINNACNMSCIYCDESNSSRIHHENKKFGYHVPGIPFNHSQPHLNIVPVISRSDQYQALVEKFFLYLDNNYYVLRRLHVLGGEPFYQKEFFRLVDYVCKNHNPDLKLNVISNLMVSDTVLENFVENIRQALVERRISRLDITASIDCWGAEQEYVRHGLDLDQWRRNFEYLCKHKWIYITINSTITNLTIKTMPNLLSYINDIRKTRRIYHAFGLVDGRPQLHPKIMGPNYWTKDFRKILDGMPRNEKYNILSHDYMKGIATAVDAGQEDLQQQIYLKYFLDEIDRRRQQDWRALFPWLSSKLDGINVV